MAERRLVHPSQIEDAASDPDRDAWTYAELKARSTDSPFTAPPLEEIGRMDQPIDNLHYHQDEHGVLHRCYHKCRSWLRIALVVLLVDVLCELVTFMPIHHLFEMLGWIH
jgi:hypothetical protein